MTVPLKQVRRVYVWENLKLTPRCTFMLHQDSLGVFILFPMLTDSPVMHTLGSQFNLIEFNLKNISEKSKIIKINRGFFLLYLKN